MKFLKKPSPFNVVVFGIIYAGPLAIQDYVNIPTIAYAAWLLVGTIAFAWIVAVKKSDLFGKVFYYYYEDGVRKKKWNWFYRWVLISLVICFWILYYIHNDL